MEATQLRHAPPEPVGEVLDRCADGFRCARTQAAMSHLPAAGTKTKLAGRRLLNGLWSEIIMA